jgi:hypothetical protein
VAPHRGGGVAFVIIIVIFNLVSVVIVIVVIFDFVIVDVVIVGVVIFDVTAAVFMA